MFERFTDRARRVLVLAQEEARLLNHNFLGTEHILMGLLHEGEGVAAKVLKARGVDLHDVRQRVEKTIGPTGTGAVGAPPFTPRAKKVMELGLREALQLGHNYIGTEHLLLGLIREGEGVASQILHDVLAEWIPVEDPDDPKVAEAYRGAERTSVLMTIRKQVIHELTGGKGEAKPWEMSSEPTPPTVTFSFPADEALEVVKWLKAVDTVFGGTPGSRAHGLLRKALLRALKMSEEEAG